MSASTYARERSSRGTSAIVPEANSSSDSESDIETTPPSNLRGSRDSRGIGGSSRPYIPPRPDTGPTRMGASGVYLDLDAQSLSNTQTTNLDNTYRSAFQPTNLSRATMDLDGTMDRRHEDPNFLDSLPRGVAPPPLIAEQNDSTETVQMTGFGNRQMLNPNPRDSGREINPGNIGTYRGATRYGDSIADTSQVHLQTPARQHYVAETSFQTNKDKASVDLKDEEKKRMMCHKYSLFALCMFVLLGGLIAAVIVFKKSDASPDKGLGSKLPEPITWDECPSKTLTLGSTLNFTCRFNVRHDYRKQLSNTSVDISLNNSRGEEVSGLVFEFSVVGSERVLTVLNGPSLTCSHADTFLVIFRSRSNESDLLHTATVTIAIKASVVESSMQQVLTNPGDVTKLGCSDNDVTMFKFACSISNDCNNYNMDFFGNLQGRLYSFKHNMSFTSGYSKENGYNVSGSVTFSESDVSSYGSLGCRFSSPRKTHRRLFELPTCNHHSNCTTPPSRWYFNCTKNSTHQRTLQEGTCDSVELTRCFKFNDVQRPSFSYLEVPYYDKKYECDNNGTYVCRLGWCKKGTRIVKDENPVVALCGEGTTR